MLPGMGHRIPLGAQAAVEVQVIHMDDSDVSQIPRNPSALWVGPATCTTGDKLTPLMKQPEGRISARGSGEKFPPSESLSVFFFLPEGAVGLMRTRTKPSSHFSMFLCKLLKIL